jgi:hypothetical protein
VSILSLRPGAVVHRCDVRVAPSLTPTSRSEGRNVKAVAQVNIVPPYINITKFLIVLSQRLGNDGVEDGGEQQTSSTALSRLD